MEYDSLVSLQLNKRLEPIAELLNSNILNELPLDLFGIEPGNLLELLSNAPSKISAFIGTLIEIARNYNMSVEQFYLTALRTYQEMHNNYFEDLEAEATRFREVIGLNSDTLPVSKRLTDLLENRYGYQISPIDSKKNPELAGLRSLLLPRQNRLLLNSQLSNEQRDFILARELGYQALGLTSRLYTTAFVEAESFEPLLNNYKASYFAGAVIIDKRILKDKLAYVFNQPQFDPDFFLAQIAFFDTTPETLFYRISNILPVYFGIDQLYFLRIHQFEGENIYTLSKEMHLARKHHPHTVRDEHYCRRWTALTSLQSLATQPTRSFCGIQRVRYHETSDEYLEITVAKTDELNPSQLISVTMGIHLNEHTRNLIKFSTDPGLVYQEVGQTCERCAIFDCKERMAAPNVIKKKHQQEIVRKAIHSLSQS